VRLAPSHWLAQAGSPVVEPLHLGRAPRGGPLAGEQRPAVPVSLHASHWPLHALLQHTASTQKPDVHSFARRHACPFALPVHALPVHFRPGVQSVSAAHVVLHAPVVESQRYGAHGVVDFGVHVPVVEHVDSAADDVPDVAQAAGAQVVPLVVTRQAPDPLHTPSDAHAPVPIVPHSVSGSVPSLMFSQRPSTL